jgi:hypothetical protein
MMRRGACVIAASLLPIVLVACDTGGHAAHSSLLASPLVNAWGINGTLAVYDGPAPDGSGHVVSVVQTSSGRPNETARVVARARVAYRTPPLDRALIDLPYVSTSRSAVYVLDGDSSVLMLARDGSLKKVASIPGSKIVRATFAVNPDDTLIAVGAWEVTTPGWRSTVYVEKLGGGEHVDVIPWGRQGIYWPVGWHAGKIILAGGPEFADFPPPRNQYSATYYQLLDPRAGATPSSVSTAADCVPTGLLTSAGTACVASPDGLCMGGTAGTSLFPHNFNSCLRRYDWAGHETLFLLPETNRLFAQYGALSPDGRAFMTEKLDRVLAPTDGTHVAVVFSGPLVIQQPTFGGWIDSRHFSETFLTVNGLFQHMFTLNSNYSSMVEVPMESPVQGQLLGTLPGGL